MKEIKPRDIVPFPNFLLCLTREELIVVFVIVIDFALGQLWGLGQVWKMWQLKLPDNEAAKCGWSRMVESEQRGWSRGAQERWRRQKPREKEREALSTISRLAYLLNLQLRRNQGLPLLLMGVLLLPESLLSS